MIGPAEGSSGHYARQKYFAYAAELLKVVPPHITEQPMIAQLQKIGFEVGKSFELGKANPAIRKALESVPEDAQQLMAWKIPTLAHVVNGWSMNTDTIGVYGNIGESVAAKLREDQLRPASSRRVRSCPLCFTSRRSRPSAMPRNHEERPRLAMRQALISRVDPARPAFGLA